MNTAGKSLKSFISHFVIQGTAIFRARLVKWEGAGKIIHLYKAAGFEIKEEDVEGLTKLLSEILPDPLTAAGLIRLFEYADDRDHMQLGEYLTVAFAHPPLAYLEGDPSAIRAASSAPTLGIFDVT